MKSSKCPIQSQIALQNDTIKDLMERIEDMQMRIDLPELKPEKRAVLQTELNEIKKLLETNKELLSGLHKENSKSFLVAVCVMFLCFLIYGIYCMITNEEK